jgi:hypothetical protein
MPITIHFVRICLFGLLHSLIGKRSREWAAAKMFFGPPDQPLKLKLKPTLLRALRLAGRSLRMMLLGAAPRDELGSSKVMVIWCGTEPDPVTYVTEFGARKDELTLLNQLAAPNCLSIVDRLLGFSLIGFWSLLVVPVTLVTRNSSFATRVIQCARAILVAGCTRHVQPERAFFYSSFQRYGNLVSVLINAVSTTRVVRIPSANPLAVHYSICVSDEFVLTSPSQVTEIKQLWPNWQVQKLWLWRPPNFPKIPQESYVTWSSGPLTLGLLSGAQWRRHERGDYFDEERMRRLEAEKNLHEAIGRYLAGRPDLSVLVYPHPCEKNDPEVFQRTRQVYHERIGTERVEIVGPDQTTYERYRDACVLVSLSSTSALDAIYCGQKVLFANLGCEAQQKDPAFHRIKVSDEPALFDRLTEFLSITADEYFARNGLEDYRHDRVAELPIPIPLPATGETVKSVP